MKSIIYLYKTLPGILEYMDKQEKLTEITNEMQKTFNYLDWTPYQKNKAWFEIFNNILELATVEEKLHFTTLFSRLAYVGTKYKINGQTMHLSHIYRRAHRQGIIREDSEILYMELGRYICSTLLNDVFDTAMPEPYIAIDDSVLNYFFKEKIKIKSFKPVIEAVVYEVDTDQYILHFYEEDQPSIPRKAQFNVQDRNELFTPNIDSLTKTFNLPIEVNFINTDIDEDGTYFPSGIVIQPDRLLDVTAISSCFNHYGAEPFLYLINKFKPLESSTPIMIGNLVNFILDELVNDTSIAFKDLLPKLFKFNPLGFANLDDDSVKDVLTSLNEQFNQLCHTINTDFREKEIEKERIFLEPSFYSRDYGIQGRLDLLHEHKDSIQSFDIIELKSGKTFIPNVYGINASHYIQTLLYDLMIKSTFKPKTKSFNYILYSKEKEKSLRFAPPVHEQQYQAMKVRNDLIAIEYKLTSVNFDNRILKYLKPENFERLKGFNKDDIIKFNNIYNSLNELQQSFFDHYTTFIAREHFLAKIGEACVEKNNGHAALWLESRDEKSDRFSILDQLQILDNQSSNDDAFITFKRFETDKTLVNFRTGDIAVLYMSNRDTYRAVLKNQIFKCTITDLNTETVTIKLRNKQYNQSLFCAQNQWVLELDSLDSGFNGMYKNLYTWADATPRYKDLYLGIQQPLFQNLPEKIIFDDNVTEIQSNLLNKILRAQDYFLLWGPPGTGKTSVILKNLTKYLHEQTQENILLLAYTNRAVDEICEAICSIHPDYENKFVRIGSRNSTAPKYKPNLIDTIMADIHTRKDILHLLHEKRIFISTVSSISSKPELLKIKKFDTVIIDEASQILEPMLCGLLSNFKRFILIGDHKQLPAVVVQDNQTSAINNKILNEYGFINTRNSFFERLHLQCVSNGWSEAYSILNEQGRMHIELMSFPNQYFYKRQLLALNGLFRLQNPHFFSKVNDQANWVQKRKVFINTSVDDSINWKTNVYEAEKCVDVIYTLLETYKINNIDVHEKSIGIITPYRAQITLIRKYLESKHPEILPLITIDTVERYQGSARDIIIISFCINKLSQLDNLISLSNEGVDRKLNVAITRAKEHIILIGNKDLLHKNQIYSSLIDSYEQVK